MVGGKEEEKEIFLSTGKFFEPRGGGFYIRARVFQNYPNYLSRALTFCCPIQKPVTSANFLIFLTFVGTLALIAALENF